jgi:hypothetical protein
MKPFLDSGFLLTLLLPTSGSAKAWETVQNMEGPLHLATLQIFNAENRLQREMESADSTPEIQGAAAAALQKFRWYLEQQVFQPVRLDYDIAVDLAFQWQRRSTVTLPALLLLWPALAVTMGATHFLGFDPRTRQLAGTAGLTILPRQI